MVRTVSEVLHWQSNFRLGPTREPECDAAVASLVDMGFTEVRQSR